jgi:hypothetical protein
VEEVENLFAEDRRVPSHQSNTYLTIDELIFRALNTIGLSSLGYHIDWLRLSPRLRLAS